MFVLCIVIKSLQLEPAKMVFIPAEMENKTISRQLNFSNYSKHFTNGKKHFNLLWIISRFPAKKEKGDKSSYILSKGR